MTSDSQPHLIPLTKDEQIQALKDKLAKHGKHTLFCCWVYEGGYYNKELICTCGLKEKMR